MLHTDKIEYESWVWPYSKWKLFFHVSLNGEQYSKYHPYSYYHWCLNFDTNQNKALPMINESLDLLCASSTEATVSGKNMQLFVGVRYMDTKSVIVFEKIVRLEKFIVWYKLIYIYIYTQTYKRVIGNLFLCQIENLFEKNRYMVILVIIIIIVNVYLSTRSISIPCIISYSI